MLVLVLTAISASLLIIQEKVLTIVQENFEERLSLELQLLPVNYCAQVANINLLHRTKKEEAVRCGASSYAFFSFVIKFLKVVLGMK
jgi:hypothetical protein